MSNPEKAAIAKKIRLAENRIKFLTNAHNDADYEKLMREAWKIRERYLEAGAAERVELAEQIKEWRKLYRTLRAESVDSGNAV